MDTKWIVAEKLPKDEKTEPKALLKKWAHVAEDMALLPEKNVRLRVEEGQYVLEVSPELFEEFC